MTTTEPALFDEPVAEAPPLAMFPSQQWPPPRAVLKLEMIVEGEARPAGSKNAFLNKATGKVIVTDASGSSGKKWRAKVSMTAKDTWGDRELLDGALAFELVEVRASPQGRYRTGRNAHLLKAAANWRPLSAPDTLKIARGIEDSLTGVVFVDDSRIVDERLHKVYARRGEPPHVQIRIWSLATTVAENLAILNGDDTPSDETSNSNRTTTTRSR